MPKLPTEMEEALEIARKTRTELTSGKMSLENGICSLYAVAQLLGREEDTNWAWSELMGYGGNYPTYRARVGRMFVCEHGQIPSLVTGEVSVTPCELSVTQIEKILDPKFPKTTHILQDDDIDSMTSSQKNDVSSFPLVGWRFHNRELLRVLNGAKIELLNRTNAIIEEITYGKIPEGIFKQFQDRVNARLAGSNPAAVIRLNAAYEDLARSGDPEKASHVALSCRRLIQAVADELFPARKDEYATSGGRTMEVGEKQFLNRLEAYADSLGSDNRRYLIRKIKLLKDVCGKMPKSINEGVHANITNTDAEMLVIYSYLILGELVLESQKPDNA